MHFLSFSALLALISVIVFLALSSKRYSHYRHYGLTDEESSTGKKEDQCYYFYLQGHSVRTITCLVLLTLLVITVFTIHEFGYLTGWMTLSGGTPEGSLILSLFIHVFFLLLYGLLIFASLVSIVGVTFSILDELLDAVEYNDDYTALCLLVSAFVNYVFLSVFVFELSQASMLVAISLGSIIGVFLASEITPMPAAIQYIKSNNNRLSTKIISEYQNIDSFWQKSYQKVAIKTLVKHQRWGSIVSTDCMGLPILTSDFSISLLQSDIKKLLGAQVSIEKIENIINDIPEELKFITQRAYIETIAGGISSKPK